MSQPKKSEIETLANPGDLVSILPANPSGFWEPEPARSEGSDHPGQLDFGELLMMGADHGPDDLSVPHAPDVADDSSKPLPVSSMKSDNGRTGRLSPNHGSTFFNSVLEPGMADLFPGPPKKLKMEDGNTFSHSPVLAELLKKSPKKVSQSRCDPAHLDEDCMKKDPHTSTWKFIPTERPLSPVQLPNFFSPPKKRSAPPPSWERGENSIAASSIFGKRDGAGVRFPGSSPWDHSRTSNGPYYIPVASCSTSRFDPTTMPSTSSYIPRSGLKRSFFQDKGLMGPRPSPQVLQGVTCYVDVMLDGEDVSKFVKEKCIKMGAEVEEFFTKKVKKKNHNLDWGNLIIWPCGFSESDPFPKKSGPYTSNVTHVILKEGKMRTFLKAFEEKVPMVSPVWLNECETTGQIVDPTLHLPTCYKEYMKQKPREEAKRRERWLKSCRLFLNQIKINTEKNLVPAPLDATADVAAPDEVIPEETSPSPVVPIDAAPVVPVDAALVVPVDAAPVVPIDAAPVVPEDAAPVVPVEAAPPKSDEKDIVQCEPQNRPVSATKGKKKKKSKVTKQLVLNKVFYSIAVRKKREDRDSDYESEPRSPEEVGEPKVYKSADGLSRHQYVPEQQKEIQRLLEPCTSLHRQDWNCDLM